MLTFQQINALGQSLDNSWAQGGGRSITHHLQDDRLVLRYSTIVYFASEQALSQQMRTLEEESQQLLNKKIAEVKSSFRESTDSTLRLSEILNRDSVELIQATVLSPRKVAYYRRVVEFTIEN